MPVTHTEGGTTVAEMMLSNCPGKSSKQNRTKQKILGSQVGVFVFFCFFFFWRVGGVGSPVLFLLSSPLSDFVQKKSITFVVGNKYVKEIKR